MASRHPSEHDTARAADLRASLGDSGLSTHQLWDRALHLGGDLTPDQVRECLAGRRALSDHEHDVLAHALHEAACCAPAGSEPGPHRCGPLVPRPRGGS